MGGNKIDVVDGRNLSKVTELVKYDDEERISGEIEYIQVLC